VALFLLLPGEQAERPVRINNNDAKSAPIIPTSKTTVNVVPRLLGWPLSFN